MPQVNFMAVLVAALSSFMLGGLWYSKALFGEAWNRAANANPKEKHGHPAKVFGVSFLFALIAAFVYAWLMPPAASVGHAATQGLLVGAGVVAASFGINYQFANRGATLWLIDGGYHSAQFLIYGLIISLWR